MHYFAFKFIPGDTVHFEKNIADIDEDVSFEDWPIISGKVIKIEVISPEIFIYQIEGEDEKIYSLPEDEIREKKSELY